MTPQLLYYNFAPGVKAFSSTRHGGVSTGAYSSFNVNAWCGDQAEHIEQNRQALYTLLGIDSNHLVMPHQTHGTEVRQIGQELFSMNEKNRAMALEGVDAVTTNLTGVCVGVSTADCIPVLLYDPQHHAVAAVHAGWRGTVQRIVVKTLQHMQQAFGSQPQHIRAVIGPGISLEAFEVGDEVYEAFSEAEFPMNNLSRREPAKSRFPNELNMKWHIDLPMCNQWLMVNEGIRPENIQQTGVCTYRQSDDFFSARKHSVHCGRILTAIMIV